MRALLLRLTRAKPPLEQQLLALAARLEQLGLWRQPLFYRAALDYAFWAGVEVALGESPKDGALAKLATELNRGPIDLLLHG
jgi:hypothetical protein